MKTSYIHIYIYILFPIANCKAKQEGMMIMTIRPWSLHETSQLLYNSLLGVSINHQENNKVTGLLWSGSQKMQT